VSIFYPFESGNGLLSGGELLLVLLDEADDSLVLYCDDVFDDGTDAARGDVIKLFYSSLTDGIIKLGCF